MTATRTEDNQILAAALDYAAMGWRIIPIRPKSKLPLIKAWQKNATADTAQLKRWWAQWPDANVGVALGEASGLIDVECDSEAAEREFLALFRGETQPQTTSYRGQRGLHRLYRWQPTQGGAVLHVGKIEIRTGNGGRGAQSVFPPSIHPSGAIYQWIVPPSECAPAEIPMPLLAAIWNLAGEELLLPADGSALTPVERAERYVAAIEGQAQGTRNMHGYRVACILLRDFALDHASAWPILAGWNRRNTPPLPEAELRRLLAAADKYGLGIRGAKLESTTPAARKPKAWEPAPPPEPPPAAAPTEEFEFAPVEREQDLSAYCARLLANAKEIARPAGVMEIFRAVEAINLHREKPLSDDELKAIFTHHLSAERAKRAAEQAEQLLNPAPENVADDAMQRGKKTKQHSKLWKLTIIDSDPPRYELTSPYFRKTPSIILDAKQMNSPGAIRVAALEQAECALPKAFDKLWSKPDGLYEVLIHTAEHRDAPPEQKRHIIIAERLRETLAHARVLQEGEKPDRRGKPCLMLDGSVVFLFTYVWEDVSMNADKITRNELSAVLELLGADWFYLDHMKFKRLSRESLEKLDDLLLAPERTTERI